MTSFRLILAATALAACVPAADPPRAWEITSGEPFELQMGEEKQASEELTVRFAAVVGDSRCPSDVTCIWEGNAEIEVHLTRGDEQQTLALHTHGGDNYPRQAGAFGCTLQLETLEPYPVSTRETAPEDHVATLVLTVVE